MLSEKIYDHLDSATLLPEEKIGGQMGSRGTKKSTPYRQNGVAELQKKKKINQSMAWIDYCNAYDTVPGLVGIAPHIQRLFQKSMPN